MPGAQSSVNHETVIKAHLDLVNDICDILDTAVYRHGKYDCIGISIGGIVRGGCIDLINHIDKSFNLEKYLRKKYHVPVLIRNNTNTAAYGFYASHPEYKNIAFLSMPFGYRFGGVGLVLGGVPYEGTHRIAGEVKFTLLHKYTEEDNANYILLPGETLVTAEKYARSIIALNDPDIILIRCKLLPDTEILKMRLISYIPEEYLPKMKKISDEESADYMLLGMMMICVEAADKK
ncbi:MAG: ROK family protein [Lachnospiraceae bacterium]|nr:ROK family protein [Lachnospiraceae bacterium]